MSQRLRSRNYSGQCKQCDKTFAALRPRDKFCSPKCKDRWKDRRRDPEYRKKYSKEWGQRNRDHRANYQLRYTFGITLEQYNELLNKQNGCCAICEKHHSQFNKRLHVDHRHGGPRKGEITGLLCWSCNTMLIGKHHDPELFRKAATYLEGGTGWFVPIKKRKKRKRK